jgi:hypothetical protein
MLPVDRLEIEGESALRDVLEILLGRDECGDLSVME